MNNPWKDLKEINSQWVLPMDQEEITRYTDSQRDIKTKIVASSLLEPFIGNPRSAKLVLLLLNPGHVESDVATHKKPDFREAILHNLRHEPMEYPFYPLNPAFADSGSSRWWRAILGPLQRKSGLDDRTLSQKVMAIEWFPYHSERSGLPRERICRSQEYSFDLARAKLDEEGTVVLGTRSQSHWVRAAGARFGNMEFVKNKRRPFISRGNLSELVFDQILQVIGSS